MSAEKTDPIHRLEISFVRGDAPPPVPSIGVWRGGSGTLLRWLETRLGLQAKAPRPEARAVAYARLLEGAKGASYRDSLETDRWGTARELLERRDELRLEGWDGKPRKGLPPLVNDLADAEAGGLCAAPSEAERLAAVLSALGDGQLLPEHRVDLLEPAAEWPKAWQAVLARLNVAEHAARAAEPLACAKSALRHAQLRLAAAKGASAKPDDTLVHLRALSGSAAVEAVAAMLASQPNGLAGTVIVCEDDLLAWRLDLALRRLGLPCFGSRIASTAHPALQVLPLALELLWEPVDPYQLMDFLTLPAGPIPAEAASKLAAALAEQPGMGSREWLRAMDEARSKENDPDGAIAKRLDAWFGRPGAARAKAAPAGLFAKRAALVAQWAMGRGSFEKEERLRDAFEALAGQAALFADLLDQLGGAVNEPQMERLLAGLVESGLPMIELPAQAGGATLASGLADIRDPYDRFVWLGLRTGDAPASRWSVSERRALEAAGIMMDRGSRTLAVRRAAERAGFSNIRASALLVDLPGREGTRRHPIALQALSVYEGEAPLLEDLIAQGGMKGAWAFSAEMRDTRPPQPLRAVWKVQPEDLAERETTSAGDLEARLGCPLKWVLRYQARLHASSAASIPEGNQLKGTFAHALIEAAFPPADPPRSAKEASDRVRAEFKKRLATEAAPLASAAAARERLTLERQVAAAAEALHSALERGRYEIVGFEHTPEGKLLGRRFEGRLDLLARGHDKRSAIIDLKYTGSRTKYVELLAQGRATQLAVYAAAGAPDGKRGVAAGTAAAYLLLAQAKVATPEGSPLAGAQPHERVPGAASVAQTWSRFASALEEAEGWLATGKVSAWPLTPPEEWPEDAAMAIKPWKANGGGGMEVCDFCDFQALCGLRRID